MMQAAEAGERDDLAELGQFDAAMIRRALGQGQVDSVLVVPVAELAKQRPCVPSGEHDDVVEALAAKGANLEHGAAPGPADEPAARGENVLRPPKDSTARGPPT